MKTAITALVVIVVLCGCTITTRKGTCSLHVSACWDPSHLQKGKNVTAIVRIIVCDKNPFVHPVTGEEVCQNKGVILAADKERGTYAPTGLLVYLYASESFKRDSVLEVKGLLDVSQYQVKGGRYPASIRVEEHREVDLGTQ